MPSGGKFHPPQEKRRLVRIPRLGFPIHAQRHDNPRVRVLPTRHAQQFKPPRLHDAPVGREYHSNRDFPGDTAANVASVASQNQPSRDSTEPEEATSPTPQHP
jgi:hypothetical protein